MAMAEDGATQPHVTPANPSSDMPSSSNSCKKKLTPRRRKQ
jgi:hypothetical protein